MSADLLSTDALDWALCQHKRHGDTNIFPIPFEIEALEAKQETVSTGCFYLAFPILLGRSSTPPFHLSRTCTKYDVDMFKKICLFLKP